MPCTEDICEQAAPPTTHPQPRSRHPDPGHPPTPIQGMPSWTNKDNGELRHGVHVTAKYVLGPNEQTELGLSPSRVSAQCHR